MKKVITLILSMSLCLSMAACGSKPAPTSSAAESTPAESTLSESASEESAPAEAQEMDPAKKAMLVVSFGTSYNETRAETIEAVENKIAEAYPEYEMRRAFTSQIIIDKLESRDGLKIDNVQEAMERLIADGVGTLAVQPTHVMNGFEYDEMIAAIEPYADKFASISYGLPLLISDEDYAQVVSLITEETAAYNVAETAVVFMGHGTEHEANATYAKLQDKLTEAGFANYFIGTVEATPSLDDVIAAVKATDAKKVVLLPLMIVAGDHANNDMAGDEEGSWKTAFKNEGYEVECVLKGLGSYPGIQDMFVAHAGDAIAAKAE